MKDTTKLFRLEGVIQRYSWGGSVFLPALLNKENRNAEPFAEYWLGAHANAPSIIITERSHYRADQFISQNLSGILGPEVARRFDSLPYLLKVLDVRDMLSIQVHPDKVHAKLGYESENKKGISRDDPARNYKDSNHKPELMLALSDFWLLHGFKKATSLEKILTSVDEFKGLAPIFKEGGYAKLYRYVMELDQQKVNAQLQPLLNRIKPHYENGKLKKSEEHFWAARAAGLFNKDGKIDRGLYSVYFFNLVQLQPGEAIFQDAGIPHAYLEGQNMEIMANSDNVLRGGLTNKHVDVTELMKHIRFQGIDPHIIRGEKQGSSAEEIYRTPAKDFQLSRIKLASVQSFSLTTKTTDIYFVFEGNIVAKENKIELQCRKGDSFMTIAGAEVKISANQPAIIFRASVPSSE